MNLENTLARIRPLNRSVESAAQARLDSLTKPRGSLGRLEKLARRVAAIQGQVAPRLGRKILYVFAADHGIAEEGVSAYPKEVTAQMTENLLNGGAAINALARHHDVDIEIIDVGVDHPFAPRPGLRDRKIRRGTANFARGPAMSRAEALRAVELGIGLAEDAAAQGVFLLGAGDMGIGNTTSASAILCALTGASLKDAVGRGTGVHGATFLRKLLAVQKGLDVNLPDPSDPLDVLAKVGGLEIGAMTGVMLGAAAARIPMVLDGFIAGAAALLAQGFCPYIRDFLFASHLSAENGHRLMLKHLRLDPVLDLSMRLGEGTGACLLMGIIEAAVKVMREMATFESAGVKDRIP
ncbi:MAG TPA: nicotinate-nucleotide--dimethylbenzimidazole phosphoribosyltransferase [Methylomirabilota bacterium]|nr:nicotinate-nucleotide--dimethylbenzimidazole phosphoribosyltransferase [Methylomirabilota bacterium]